MVAAAVKSGADTGLRTAGTRGTRLHPPPRLGDGGHRPVAVARQPGAGADRRTAAVGGAGGGPDAGLGGHAEVLRLRPSSNARWTSRLTAAVGGAGDPHADRCRHHPHRLQGPALFRQVRAGRDGTTFVCYKYRTMVVDADSQRAALREEVGGDGATFKMERDPRSPVWPVLRRYSIDELPQLMNAARRHEPGRAATAPARRRRTYDDVATRRLLSKPGMTGLWQVSGRSDIGWDDAVMLDLYYVENWSLADVVILLRTTKVVLRRSGAY